MWTVKHKDGTCAMKHQPDAHPCYRDSVETMCGHVVTLPLGFGGPYDTPTCAECRRIASERQRAMCSTERTER